MGTITISGALTLTGTNPNTIFFSLNTAHLIVTPGLTPAATINFLLKSTLLLPANAILDVSTGGLSGTCTNLTQIYIGTSYAACVGGGGVDYTFPELIAAGGSLYVDVFANGVNPLTLCSGNSFTLTATPGGLYKNTPTYSWTGRSIFILSSESASHHSRQLPPAHIPA